MNNKWTKLQNFCYWYLKKKVNHIREDGKGNICLQLVLLEKEMDNI